jgi:hypothetical protein
MNRSFMMDSGSEDDYDPRDRSDDDEDRYNYYDDDTRGHPYDDDLNSQHDNNRNPNYYTSATKFANYNISFDYLSLNQIIKNYDINNDIFNKTYLNNSVDLIDTYDSHYLNDLLNNNDQFYIKIKMKELIENEKKKYFDNKHEYFTKKKIFTLLTNCGAGIFGGSIRDSLLHDYGARKFYEYISKNISYRDNINLIYGDKKFHEESYIDRNLIFKDIDTVMNIDHFKLFLLELDLLTIKYSYVKHNNFNEYIDISNLENLVSSYIVLNISITNPCNDLSKEITYSKYVKDLKINHFLKNFKKCNFKIDILLCNEDVSVKKVLDIITSNSDFYCNSLYLFNNKLEINEIIAKKLKDPCYDSLYEDPIKKNIDLFFKKEVFTTDIINIVKTQILEKNAIAINLSKKTEKRIFKMERKGFKLIYNNASQDIYEYITCNDDLNNDLNENVCILCRSEFTISNINSDAIKFKCCNSYYHKSCLLELCYLNQYKNCIYCNKITDYSYLTLCLNPDSISNVSPSNAPDNVVDNW